MLIPSIDLRASRAVQLVGGREQALDAGSPQPLAQKFGRVGEIAIVDLDAALGTGDNTGLIHELLVLAPCRVGGGIRSADQALTWLDAGASKVVLGTAARREVLEKLPRERVVVALDAHNGEVVVEGWQRPTGRGILERIAELRDCAGEFLVTFVEREGRMEGTNLELARRIVEAAAGVPVTIAGGITTAAEVAALDAMGASAQLGMSLYTGRLGLAEAFAAPLKSDRSDGLWPTIVCNESGVALGLAWSSPESLRASLESGCGVYESRSRGLWRKGESSGNTQELLRASVDCDRDALRFLVRQKGKGFCHNETLSCWGAANGLSALEATLSQRLREAPPASYTRRLLDSPELLAAKLQEEARELAEAKTFSEVQWESADLLYFICVAMARSGVTLADVARELDRRALRVSRRGGEAKIPLPSQTTSFAPQKKEARLLKTISPGEATLRRRGVVDEATLCEAALIVRDVREGGWQALERQTLRLNDREEGTPLLISPREMRAAFEGLEAQTRALLERSLARVRAFAKAQLETLAPLALKLETGGTAGQTAAPVAAAGCYAPGGRFPLPSSVIMTAATAKAAGVKTVWVASPRPTAAVLGAAWLCGAEGLLAAGGAQAIAALAYGAGDVPRCDVIAGPGNRWVTAAKKIVSGDVRIDMLAGPSELVVVADGTADPERVASDLLAQAEHDSDAVPILVALDPTLPERVERSLRRQLPTLPTEAIARKALANGFCVVASDWPEAVAICDEMAPEHLQLDARDAPAQASAFSHYGALFLGACSAEVFGDYCVGPNHTLPTGGTARSQGGLSVFDFLRIRTWLQLDAAAAAAIAPDAASLARLEGLEGHARAAERRLQVRTRR